MGAVAAAILFIFGVAVAVLSAYLVIERKRGWIWYALPSLYCVLVAIVTALISGKSLDVVAIVFFSVVLSMIGYATVKFELRRR